MLPATKSEILLSSRMLTTFWRLYSQLPPSEPYEKDYQYVYCRSSGKIKSIFFFMLSRIKMHVTDQTIQLNNFNPFRTNCCHVIVNDL